VATCNRLITLLPPKSSPLDCLPVSLLKQNVVIDVMAPLLAQLANLSFAAGIFPSRYKLSHVIPLLKKPGLDITDPANYRPITNLCTSKVLEKLALTRLQPHILSCDNYYFSRFQWAYRLDRDIPQRPPFWRMSFSAPPQDLSRGPLPSLSIPSLPSLLSLSSSCFTLKHVQKCCKNAAKHFCKCFANVLFYM